MSDVLDLVKAVNGDVVTPLDPSFRVAIARWARNTEREARVVVFTKTPQDVVASILYAKANNLPFAVRGGGHYAGPASSVAGGVVVDLSRYMNTVRVDPDTDLGYVGGGALWKDVDEEAIKFGLATVGGTVNHTGVGGLSLGGGFGWLSGRYGLTIDNVRQATVVTANGSILTANTEENPDLYWGIRGGGSNFGVVTEFVYQLYPQNKTVFAGYVVFTPDKVEQIVNLTTAWFRTIKPDESMIQAVTVKDGHPVVVLLLFYNGSEAQGRENYKAFLDIEHVFDGATEIPYEQLNSLQNNSVEHGRCYYLQGSNQAVPDAASMLAVLTKCGEVAEAGNFKPTVLYEYFNLNKANTVDDAATPFRRGLTPSILTILAWEDDVLKTTIAKDIAKEFVAIIKSNQEGTAREIGYPNYEPDVFGGPDGLRTTDNSKDWENERLSPDFDAKAKLAFGPNYHKLQQVKMLYDPDLFFNRWFPITPA
ncbi:FAD binding domain-containing protein [Coprinopsis marcescibilis]|uniref:FAD binding domain-containing protein n=1 Tax=Coprinopsis marcescibilis TaxID=230819 RepID=A0A5C3KI33_COPMA|nr:FAD binding domain-containing protein [Coprinopsis marcescibilis]